MTSPVKDININIQNPSDINNIHNLIKIIKPSWKLSSLRFKVFHEGISNTLFAIYNEPNMSSTCCVLVRIFGPSTELYIDRVNESLYLWVLHELDFAPEVYGRFINGICYGFIPGSTIKIDLLMKPKYYLMIAEKLASLHSLPIEDFAKSCLSHTEFKLDTEPCAFRNIYQYISLLPDISLLSTNEDHPVKLPCRSRKDMPSKQALLDEVAFMEKYFANARSTVTFCHNDLLSGNILVAPDHNSISLIDFEYCGYNHASYEIADHFVEYSVVMFSTELLKNISRVNEFIDISKYPPPEMQRDWLRAYMIKLKQISAAKKNGFKNNSADAVSLPSVSAAIGGEDYVDEKELDALLREVQRFFMVPQFLWGVWALVQSFRSNIDFDYVTYGMARIDEYFRLKQLYRDSPL